ncbi:hypothetical protein VTJ83DRAFT_1822 [Remersonia thermophila]|uniref:Uncharacterized protein n=1 Tax=Remersonia thermophila TaxID=72144 RepID=A0ABR4DGZ4_9PEZI
MEHPIARALVTEHQTTTMTVTTTYRASHYTPTQSSPGAPCGPQWPTRGDLAAICAGVAVVAILAGAIGMLLFTRKTSPEPSPVPADDQEDGRGVHPLLSPADLISRIEDLGSKISRHVQGTYRLPKPTSKPTSEKERHEDGNQFHETPDVFRASDSLLQAVAALPFLKHDAQLMAHILTAPSTRHVALRHLLAAALFSAIDYDTYTERTMLPPAMLDFWRVVPSVKGNRIRTEALWKWQQLSLFLLHLKPPSWATAAGNDGQDDAQQPLLLPTQAPAAAAMASSSSSAPSPIPPQPPMRPLDRAASAILRQLMPVLNHFVDGAVSDDGASDYGSTTDARGKTGSYNKDHDNGNNTKDSKSPEEEEEEKEDHGDDNGKHPNPTATTNAAVPTLLNLIGATARLGHALLEHPCRWSFCWELAGLEQQQQQDQRSSPGSETAWVIGTRGGAPGSEARKQAGSGPGVRPGGGGGGDVGGEAEQSGHEGQGGKEDQNRSGGGGREEEEEGKEEGKRVVSDGTGSRDGPDAAAAAAGKGVEQDASREDGSAPDGTGNKNANEPGKDDHERAGKEAREIVVLPGLVMVGDEKGTALPAPVLVTNPSRARVVL